MTNLTYLKITIDQLPGLLFCPVVCATNDAIYIAESLMFDNLLRANPADRALGSRQSNVDALDEIKLKRKRRLATI